MDLSDFDWKKLIALILRWIADGLSKEEAVAKAAKKFGVSTSSILKHGGF